MYPHPQKCVYRAKGSRRVQGWKVCVGEGMGARGFIEIKCMNNNDVGKGGV